MTATKNNIRPSALPKLQACPRYQSTAVAGPAAERGTRLDTAFRHEMQGKTESKDDLTPDDVLAVRWAANTLDSLWGDRDDILTDEEDCRVDSIPGIPSGGTADAICPSRQEAADLKSGQIRDYTAQMAAYALGLMQQHWAQQWTMRLLFCDHKEVVVLRFSFEQAREIVAGIVANAENPASPATPCEYCGWCALKDSCAERSRLVISASTAIEGEDFPQNIATLREHIAAEPNRLSDFLQKWSEATKELYDPLRQIATEKLENGEEIPDYKLVCPKPTQVIPAAALGHYIKDLGNAAVLAICGNLKAADVRTIWEQKMPNSKPFPEEIVQSSPRKPYIQKSNKKKTIITK